MTDLTQVDFPNVDIGIDKYEYEDGAFGSDGADVHSVSAVVCVVADNHSGVRTVRLGEDRRSDGRPEGVNSARTIGFVSHPASHWPDEDEWDRDDDQFGVVKYSQVRNQWWVETGYQ